MNYGFEIRKRRKKLDWTQEELAREVGINREQLVKIERGTIGASERMFVTILNSMGYDLKKRIVKKD